ncbi:tRNA (N(6)-L-threonylcarbamoyladenosine(37)-C(2))-methylthiotransferase MtaB [Methylocystis heyeri]|uniref:tRNA (N(6)-L-threonylcarbamoyladenosine(37)-C(2))- methylthiotransferase MtaB n=1 Tax=Methylocystis heyeri TaxID=391905 RepID=UPI001138D4DF|nr:tRNA (N(6)-L-threonylcarbamoyladenosine(37)-C(2))-methylthiotransferase MtaB [Methylocystis heyeri]
MKASAPAVDVVTFGCRLNIVESEELARQARAAGESDLVIVNTCAVTAESSRQARQSIRRLHRERPDAKIIVTGCAATIAPSDFAGLEGVARVIANADKSLNAGESSAWSAARAATASEGTRGFLSVQNGCDHRCTFCVIPFGRGPSRSAPPPEVLQGARGLLEAGKREIVLTGVDLTSYGADLGDGVTLGRLVRLLLKELPELERLRISSIDCIEADPDLVAAIAEEKRLMPHLHLSLQAGDDLILKRMKRRHSSSEAVRFCEELRAMRPDIVFGADFIVGFPTETEAMFRRTLDLVEECGLTHLHVFPFSSRPQTPAARMPPVRSEEIKERAARLRALGEERRKAHLSAQHGKTLRLLTERGGAARAEDFTLAHTPGLPPGQMLDLRVSGDDGKALLVV